MYVHTRNSIYSVTPENTGFRVIRVGGIADHPNMPMGWERVVPSISIGIGRYAEFGSIRTSTVYQVTETLAPSSGGSLAGDANG